MLFSSICSQKSDLVCISYHNFPPMPEKQLVFVHQCVKSCYGYCPIPGAVLGKILGGKLAPIVWEATTANRNYYRTNYINQ